MKFSMHDIVQMVGLSCEVSVDCNPYYQDGALLTNGEDSGFGWGAMRIEQPFDFAGREGHIHLKTTYNFTGRMDMGIALSPFATNTMPDLRRFADENNVITGAMNDAATVVIGLFRADDQGGRAVGDLHVLDHGHETQYLEGNGQVAIGYDRSALHDLDVFVTRTRIRVFLDNQQMQDWAMEDIGFDRAYVYISSFSYNAMKQEGALHTREFNTLLWDDIAFDGPSLAPNSLVPAGYQDVVFRAVNSSSCTVRGVTAKGPLRPQDQAPWVGWTARIPTGGPEVTESDIQCAEFMPRDGQQWGHIEIVTR